LATLVQLREIGLSRPRDREIRTGGAFIDRRTALTETVRSPSFSPPLVVASLGRQGLTLSSCNGRARNGRKGRLYIVSAPN
jgi:hypothetical protein